PAAGRTVARRARRGPAGLGGDRLRPPPGPGPVVRDGLPPHDPPDLGAFRRLARVDRRPGRRRSHRDDRRAGEPDRSPLTHAAVACGFPDGGTRGGSWPHGSEGTAHFPGYTL